jgi:hypothetical protein
MIGIFANAAWSVIRLISFVDFPRLPVLPAFSYFYFFLVALVGVFVGRYIEREARERREDELRTEAIRKTREHELKLAELRRAAKKSK